MRKIPGVSLHWPAETRAQIMASPGDAIVDRWRAAHMAKGWRDIGYHYIVHRDQTGAWQVYDGRPDSMSGAHSGTNAGNQYLGINLAYGTDEQLPQEALQALVKLIADLAKAYGFAISRHTVRGHRDFIPTECPGLPLFNRLNELIKLAQGIQSGAEIKQSRPAAVKPPAEEQIHTIGGTIDGRPVRAVLINSQAFVSAYDIGTPVWSAPDRTVHITTQKGAQK